MSARAFGGARDSYLAYRKSPETGRYSGDKPSRRDTEANGGQTSFLQAHRSHAPQRSFGHNRPARGGLAQLAPTVAAAVAPALLIQAFLVQPLRHIRKYVLATVFVGKAQAGRELG